MTDPIADMIIRIKNAVLARHEQVVMPHSKVKEAMAKILENNGYVGKVSVDDHQPQPYLTIGLKYEGTLSVISGVKRLSKPGRRLYSPANKLKPTLGGYGLTIISTSQGLMTNLEARKKNIGGELLCQIW